MNKDWWLGRTPEQQARKAALKAKSKAATAGLPIAAFAGVGLYRDAISGVSEQGPQPLKGVHAHLERGSDLERRVTATRVVTMGAVALLAKKKSGGEWWLTIDGPEFSHTVEVDAKDQQRARQFVAQVNSATKQSA